MASKAAEDAVRDYLTTLKDPGSLRDDERIGQLEKEHAEASDPIARVMLQQQLLEAKNPDMQSHEEGFVTHAKAWADAHGVSEAAFLAEGVSAAVLRRAGFSVRGADRRSRGGRRRSRQTGRSRVSADQVRAGLPSGTFTTRDVQEATGASPAVVRRVLREEVEAGRVVDEGPDPNHQGPGRAARRYRR